MTPIAKPVRRVTLQAYHFGGKPRRLVARLGPGDVLELRELGRRYTVTLALDWCYRVGVRQRVDAERAAKRLSRKHR